ncbi:MAG: hypothetical protein AAGF28_12060 [Pseudomonadota bacterium]
MASKVLMVGFHPDVVDYAKWPDLSEEKLTKGLGAQRSALVERGFEARWELIKEAEAGAKALECALKNEMPDVVLIGAGVRKDDDHFILFEELVNIIHKHAPKAAIAFNTNPSDTMEAIERRLQVG